MPLGDLAFTIGFYSLAVGVVWTAAVLTVLLIRQMRKEAGARRKARGDDAEALVADVIDLTSPHASRPTPAYPPPDPVSVVEVSPDLERLVTSAAGSIAGRALYATAGSVALVGLAIVGVGAWLLRRGKDVGKGTGSQENSPS